MYRTSIVNDVAIKSVEISGCFQVGDTEKIQSYSAVLALQRESAVYGRFDLDMKNYEIFSKEISIPLCPIRIQKKTFNADPFIVAGEIDITGVSASSVLHIGSVQEVNLQTRVKHIRNYFTNPYQKEGEDG
jgi:spore germination protein PE